MKETVDSILGALGKFSPKEQNEIILAVVIELKKFRADVESSHQVAIVEIQEANALLQKGLSQ